MASDDGAFPRVAGHDFPALVDKARRVPASDPSSFSFQMMALEGLSADDESKKYTPSGDTLAKNRYVDMLPATESRVVLRRSGSARDRALLAEPDGDYVNACWVGAPAVPGARVRYISAQAPIPGTFEDWWLMLWEQDVRVALMLTRLVEKGTVKAHQYWPGLRKSEKFGDFEVTLEERRVFVNETVRRLTLRKGLEVRQITHIQFTTWPDHGVPDDVAGVVRFFEIYRRERARHMDKPVLLHCSAGVGRTGTFAAIDVALDVLAADEANRGVCVFDIVRGIRAGRPGAVQTPQQYAFIFEVVAHAVLHNKLGLDAE